MTFKLNRFSEAKQDQIEQLVAYAELMGLSGRDLVAIGGKMDRERAKSKKIANMEIVRGFDCLPIGGDTVNDLCTRFKLKTVAGAYNFENIDGWNMWQAVSLKTKIRKTYSTDMYKYDLPKVRTYLLTSRHSLLLDIAAGQFLLNF